MSSTYSFAEALSLTKQIPKNIEENYAAYLANIAQNIIWNAYDWRQTIASLPPFYLIPNEQEYGPPAVVVPSDFLGLRETYLVAMTATGARRQELKVRHDVRLTGVQSLPSVIGYEPATQRFRVFPRVPAGIGASDFIIDGTYKKLPTKITPATLQSKIPWDDVYFHVFLATLKWAAWDEAGDQRAGQVQVQNGMTIYTGQLGVVRGLLADMADSEGLNLGDPSLAPSEPLVSPSMSLGFFYPGMF